MFNLFIAVGIGLVVCLGLFVPSFLSFGESLVPGIFAMFVAYFILARRSFKQLENMVILASKPLQTMPPDFRAGIAALERAYPLARWQFGVRSQIDGQIGMIHFLQQDFSKSIPYLERSLHFGHWMGSAMLGVAYYKKKKNADMKRVMDIVVKRGKKQALAWALYAYLLSEINDQASAIAILTKGLAATENDARLKEAVLAVQNNKKIRMKVFKEQWYQFHLERPSNNYRQTPMGSGRGSRAAMRGRW